MGGDIAVTGGTGTLGRVLVRTLRERGRRAVVLSRSPRPDGEAATAWRTTDFRTDLDAALAGAGTVVHCATGFGRNTEVTLARAVTDAARRAGVAHLVYISIVGIEKVPFPYYRSKLAAERVFADAGVPHTILRATQFHDLVRGMLAVAARSPLMPVPDLPVQPVDTHDVAARLADLAVGEPLGRAPDLGGPTVRRVPELAETYLAAVGKRRRIVRLSLPGKTFRAFRAGGHTTPEHAGGTVTFEQYLARQQDA